MNPSTEAKKDRQHRIMRTDLTIADIDKCKDHLITARNQLDATIADLDGAKPRMAGSSINETISVVNKQTNAIRDILLFDERDAKPAKPATDSKPTAPSGPDTAAKPSAEPASGGKRNK